MNWHVEVDRSVIKFLKRIPKKDASHIRNVLQEFSYDPLSGDLVKLKGEENTWRRRTGSYRIFFELFPDRRTVLIQEVRRRTSTTY